MNMSGERVSGGKMAGGELVHGGICPGAQAFQYLDYARGSVYIHQHACIAAPRSCKWELGKVYIPFRAVAPTWSPPNLYQVTCGRCGGNSRVKVTYSDPVTVGATRGFRHGCAASRTKLLYGNVKKSWHLSINYGRFRELIMAVI